MLVPLKLQRLVKFLTFILCSSLGMSPSYAKGETLWIPLAKSNDDDAIMTYVVLQQVCHHDLKLENTLIDGIPAPLLKICDSSEVLEKTHVVTTPSSGFGRAGEGFVRVSAFGHRDNVLESCRRFKELYNFAVQSTLESHPIIKACLRRMFLERPIRCQGKGKAIIKVVVKSEVEVKSEDDKSSKDDKCSEDSSEELIKFLSRLNLQWQFLKQSHEEEPKPVPSNTEEEDLLPLDTNLLTVEENLLSSSRGTCRRGIPHASGSRATGEEVNHLLQVLGETGEEVKPVMPFDH
ncbi:LL-diaminopimelate aminotransferase, chloroplastic [Tanacetum coccineum]